MKTWLKNLVIFWLSIFLSTTLLADQTKDVIRFEHITFKEDLPFNEVVSCVQDDYGFMWFGSTMGLARYDGIEFTVYTHDDSNSNSLSDNYAWWLFKDQSGTLWIGTYGNGLNQFDAVHDQFIRYTHDANNPDSLNGGLVWSVYQDRNGVLWVGTDNGLDRFHPESQTFSHYVFNPDDPHSLSHNAVTQIYEDKEGFLWVATYGGGVNRLDPERKKFTRYQYDEQNPRSLSNDSVWAVYVDQVGSVWIGTEGGLNRFDPQTESFIRYQHDEKKPHSLSHDTVTSILQDENGKLWVGTYGGLNQLDPQNGTFTSYQKNNLNPSSLSENIVWNLCKDKTGTLWIANYDINKYDAGSSRFAHYYYISQNTDGLSDKRVSAIYEDTQGFLWLGTKGGGLNKFDRVKNTFTHYRHHKNNLNSLSSDIITTLEPERTGKLWIATEGGGINHFDPVKNKFVRYQHQEKNSNSLANDNVYDIELDHATGNLWIATSGGGLDHFNPTTKTFTHYLPEENNPNSLVSEWARVVKIDSAGLVWIGTEGGLSSFDPATQTFTNYRPGEHSAIGSSLAGGVVYSLYEDQHNWLWIGTNNGLNKFDKTTGTFTTYRKKQGLAGNVVYAITEDLEGHLWISTEGGLSEFRPQSATFRNYDKRDGLQSNQFIALSVYFSKRGELFFGGVNGFNAFYPAQLTDNPHIPPIVLTDFQIFNRPVPIGENSPLQQHISLADRITLSHSQFVFSFEFAALNYRSAEKNRYAYKMEGIDEDWVTVDSKRRFAIYTKLHPGKYLFRVRGSNNDDLWNETGTSVEIVVLPPWWSTWWAYTFYLVMTLGSILIFIIAQQRKLARTRAINEQLQQLDKLKDEFLANTSHELKTPLNGIIGIAGSLIDGAGGEISEKVKYNLAMIVSSGQRLTHLVNDILDFSKLKHKNLVLQVKPISLRDIVEVVLTLSHPLIKQKSIGLINAIAPDLPTVAADENRLQQILYNLVGNAIKFTEVGKVEVSAEVLTTQKIAVTISDTGIGIEVDQFDKIFESFAQADGSTAREYGGTGLGLAVTRQLVELHGGRIWLESEVGKGSKFTFTLPISDEKAQPISMISNQLAQTYDIVAIEANLNLVEDFISANDLTNRFTILIVDDEPVNLQVIKNYLSLQNYHIIQATSGQEVLQLVESGFKPDMVLLDVMMPKMTGYEITKKLREHWEVDELPILLLTAKNQVNDLIVGLESGANDYLTKPIAKDELLARVTTHLRLLQLNKAHERFVPREFLKLLGKRNITQIQLGDQVEKEMTVLFSDIRGFTTLSEKMTPQENFNFINSYLKQMTPIIQQYQGFIDKYIGDAIMALFPTNADDALRSAIAMLRKLEDYNQQRRRAHYQPIQISIGLNTGALMLGMVGEENRMEGTVISDTVNLAARIESVTRKYGATLLISEYTFAHLQNPSEYTMRPVDRIRVKGKSEAVTVYEVFDGDNPQILESKQKNLPLFAQGVHAYRSQQFNIAKSYFQQMLSICANDEVAQLYIKRCEHFAQEGVPEGWNGTEILETK